MWYDVGETLTHNALINIVIGPRGYGKSYGLKKKCIADFIKKEKQFIYLRRYQAELDLVKETHFDDIIEQNEFDGKIEYKKKEKAYTYNGEICGYPMALSRANHYKSASFPRVSLIVFDEFIVDQSQGAHYLKSEVRKLLDFIETIARMREDIRVFLLGNSLSFFNPYTIFWNLKQPQQNQVTKTKDNLVLAQMVGDDEFTARKKKTRFGQLVEGTAFAESAIENQFILDNDIFVEEKPGNAKYVFTMEYMGASMGVWIDWETSTYYLDTHTDPSCGLVYATTMEDHAPNTRLLKRSNAGLFGALITAFKRGNVRFDSRKTKSFMMDVFKMTLN